MEQESAGSVVPWRIRTLPNKNLTGEKSKFSKPIQQKEKDGGVFGEKTE